MKQTHIIILVVAAVLFAACRVENDTVIPDGPVQPRTDSTGTSSILYVLNEGNMGSNKATVDLYDITADSIIRDVYPRVNPSVVKELGDVGNDIAVYGNKMYIVVNVSGKVEITDLNCRRITQVNVPNCRSIAFHDGYAYVTSYAGPIDYGNPEYKQRGYVIKIDTATLSVTDTCIVGFQPNGIATDGNSLYVANSGGYMAPKYDSTLSVVSLSDFRETERLTVAVNLDAVCYDSARNALFVSSLGDYSNRKASLFRIDLATKQISDLRLPVTKFCFAKGKIYYYNFEYGSTSATFGVLDAATLACETLILKNATSLRTPYCIFTDGENDIYVTDARDYVTPGVLYRYAPDGTLKAQHRTGDIPGHIVKITNKTTKQPNN